MFNVVIDFIFTGKLYLLQLKIIQKIVCTKYFIFIRRLYQELYY